ncbi:MAG: RNA polymerase factor sigma-54 [Bacillota bacterium]|nr:RNA polymerase factor sigma-54 [Bacillota bacterium]
MDLLPPLLSLHQEQRPAVKVIPTPSLWRALRILQVSSSELEALLSQELVNNPLLERPDPCPGEVAAGLGGGWREEGRGTSWERWEEEAEWEEVPWRPSLREHLWLQVQAALPPGPERRAAEFFVRQIDQDGYLCSSPEEAAALCGVSLESAQRALAVVQGCEPSGVGSRSLAECLSLQLKHRGQWDELRRRLIQECLPLVAKGRWKAAAERLGISPEEVRRLAAELRDLDPRPGRGYGGEARPGLLRPDLALEPQGAEFAVLVHEWAAPTLRLSEVYSRLLEQEELETSVRAYLQRQLKAARFLLRCLERRRQTLFLIGSALVRHQRDFLERGPAYLRPLTLRAVAAEVGLHPSTVGRAVANKYAQTPWGIFPLSRFFDSGVRTRSGQGLAAGGVKARLAELCGERRAAAP